MNCDGPFNSLEINRRAPWLSGIPFLVEIYISIVPVENTLAVSLEFVIIAGQREGEVEKQES